jgi:outer membrane protein assembly factor BamB
VEDVVAAWDTDPDSGDEHDHDHDQPVLDIRPLSDDVVPLGDVYFIDDTIPTAPPPPPPPRTPLGRPVVGSTLTGLGLVGTVVAAALPWSGGQGLTGVRALANGRSWVLWLLLAVAAAVVLGVLVLARPGRRTRWWGAVAALAAAALSGWAVVGLPGNREIGPGPGLACVALVLLAAGQVLAAVSRPPKPRWRWRPAGIAAAVAVVVLAAAGFGSASLVRVRDVDATTAAGPIPVLSGPAPTVLNTELWRRNASVYDVAGSSALVFGHSEHGATTMIGVSILDIRTGVERWHHYERGWSLVDTAFTDDGTIAILVVDTATGTDAVGFDAATGNELWHKRIAAGYQCAGQNVDEIAAVGGCIGKLITGDGILYVNGPSGPYGGPDPTGPVTYLNARTGKTWPIKLDNGCRLRGAGADANGLYVLDQCVTSGFPEPHLLSERAIGYDLDGEQRWSVPLALVRGTVAGGVGPVFVRSDVVLVQQEQRFVALDTGTGTQLWTTTDSLDTDTTVTDGQDLVWAAGVQVTMIDLHSGHELWQRPWHFPDEADLPALAGGHLYLIQHTIGPNPYSCAERAQLLLLDPVTGQDTAKASGLPNGAGNDCGPDVQDRTFLVGPLMVLLTANTITVLTGP